MANFDTQIELQEYLDKELAKRELEIDNVLYRWLTNSRKSEMFLLNNQGKRVIDIDKAKEHFKLVEVYDMILSNDIELKILNKNSDEPNIINEKQLNQKLQIERIRNFTTNKLTEIGITYSIDELKQDFKGNRNICKNLFKNIFNLYGIDFDDKAINRLFERVSFKKNKEEIDAIWFFGKGTHLQRQLVGHFSICDNGKANGLFSAFFMRSAGLLEFDGNERTFEEPIIPNSISGHNPFFREKIALRILAKVYVSCYSKKKYLTQKQ